MAEAGEATGAPVTTSAPQAVVQAAAQALLQGPTAWWCLARPTGTVQWANEAAQALIGQQRTAPGASFEEWAAGAGQAMGWEPWVTLCREALLAPSQAGFQLGLQTTISRAWPRLVQGQPQLWLLTAHVQDEAVLVMAVQADAVVHHTTTSSAHHPLQRDLLVREVHHRLKNNLQGVSGLLNQQASLHPEAARWLQAAASQLQAMAQVYGLQTQGAAAPSLTDLVRSVAQSVASVFGVVMDVEEAATSEPPADARPQGTAPSSRELRQTLWAHLEPSLSGGESAATEHAIHPDQAGALALVINELLTNAVKHRLVASELVGVAPKVDVRCIVTSTDSQAAVEIVNAGCWPGGLEWDQLSPGVHGLGLIKALLPSRGARLSFHTEPGLVCARLQIGPPVWCPRVQSP